MSTVVADKPPIFDISPIPYFGLSPSLLLWLATAALAAAAFATVILSRRKKNVIHASPAKDQLLAILREIAAVGEPLPKNLIERGVRTAKRYFGGELGHDLLSLGPSGLDRVARGLSQQSGAEAIAILSRLDRSRYRAQLDTAEVRSAAERLITLAGEIAQPREAQ